MAEPTVPGEVYREAAIAYTATAGWEPRVRKAASEPYAQERQFRAAVESAYRAGLAAALRTDECDDKMTGIFGQPNLFCERPLGQRGWHQCGETKWRQADG